jgi:hypothetical protein
VPSSWRSSGRMLQHMWWWTSHLGSPWTHLQNEQTVHES